MILNFVFRLYVFYIHLWFQNFKKKRTNIVALKHLRIFLSYLKFLEINDPENNHLWRNNKTKSYMFGSNNTNKAITLENVVLLKSR